MKIAISADSENLEAIVNPVFGRCHGFIIVEIEENEVKSSSFIENQASGSPRGAGIAAAQTVAGQEVKTVITGNMGPNALMVLQQAGIKIFQTVGLSVNDAIKQFLDNKLVEIKQAAGPGMGGGQGMGSGAGKGLGAGQGKGAGRGAGQGSETDLPR